MVPSGESYRQGGTAEKRLQRQRVVATKGNMRFQAQKLLNWGKMASKRLCACMKEIYSLYVNDGNSKSDSLIRVMARYLPKGLNVQNHDLRTAMTWAQRRKTADAGQQWNEMPQ